MTRWLLFVACSVALCAGCGRKNSNPGVPSGHKDAFTRLENSLAETRRDIFATPFRQVGDIDVHDCAMAFQRAAKGTNVEADTDDLVKKTQTLKDLCVKKTPQKTLQTAYGEVDAKVQEIKAKL